MTRPARTKKKNIAIRSKRLDSLNESQLALAIWLMASNLVEDQTQRPQPAPDLDQVTPDVPASRPVADEEAA